MSKVLTSTSSTFGVIKAGKLGPSLISFMPRCSRVSRIATAFCSYQERIMDRGRSLTPIPKALARATAIWMAEEAELSAGEREYHCIGRGLLHKLGIVIPARLGAVAARDQEEMADGLAFYRLDYFVGDTQHRISGKANHNLPTISIFRKAGQVQGLLDENGKIP